MNTNFEILETLALKNGRWQNWSMHWARLQITAQHFRYPLEQTELEREMQRLAQQVYPQGDWRVRLALSLNGSVHSTVEALNPTAEPVLLQLAREPMANAVARSDAVRFKTSARQHYSAFATSDERVFDVVLFNEDGQVTESTRGNIAVQLEGRWVTPPLHCGLLPGVGRALVLSQGRVQEQIVSVEQARSAKNWAFINSLRGWLDARLID